jgi:hypothetical protein
MWRRLAWYKFCLRSGGTYRRLQQPEKSVSHARRLQSYWPPPWKLIFCAYQLKFYFILIYFIVFPYPPSCLHILIPPTLLYFFFLTSLYVLKTENAPLVMVTDFCWQLMFILLWGFCSVQHWVVLLAFWRICCVHLRGRSELGGESV